MAVVKDISNMRFSMLTPINVVGRNNNGSAMWLCKCDCGNEKVCSSSLLLRGKIKSCGCTNFRIKGLQGQTFGKLTVINHIGSNYRNCALWLCRCECGECTKVITQHLLSGNVKSCGHCLNKYTIDYTKKIAIGKTSNGYEFIIDSDDLPLIRPYKWYYNDGYIAAHINEKNVHLHKLITGTDNMQIIDHINRNPLDCRRENLRKASWSGNTTNRGLRKDNKTGYKGVCFDRNGRYAAYIRTNGKNHFLGSYTTPTEAAQAYDNAARFYFGEFACTNQMIQAEKEVLEAELYV